MSEELENKTEGMSAEQTQQEGSREGYRPTTGYSNYRTPGRSPRPRIHTTRPFNANRGNNEEDGGFRPEGFGAGLQSESAPQRSYRPRNNYQGGGYQPRQGGYQPQGGYPSQGGYQGQGGGFQNRAPQGQPYRRQQFEEPPYNPAPNMQPGQGGMADSGPDPLENVDDIPF